MENLFEGAAIRSAYDRETKTRWFSAVDICSALLGCDYQRGRNYYKWFKNKMDSKYRQTVRITNRLKFEAADGRMRFTDVLDESGVMRLILMFPSPKADKFKLWIEKIASEGKKVTEHIANAVKKAKDTVRSKVGCVFETLERMDFNINGDEEYIEVTDGFSFFPQKQILLL